MQEAATKDWKWLLCETAFATEYLHPKLGPGWTAVLLEACCVRAKEQRAFLPAGEKLRLSFWREWSMRSTAYYAGVAYYAGATAYAALGGSVSLLKWLLKRGCPWDTWTCTYAASGGHLQTLKYAHENGCPWNKDTCLEAGRRGHLDVLKYLHENGCPWDRNTCWMVARRGHLDMLKYANENGCPIDKAHIRNCATVFSYPCILAWIDTI